MVFIESLKGVANNREFIFKIFEIYYRISYREEVMRKNKTFQNFINQVDRELHHFYLEEITKFNQPIVLFGIDGSTEAFLQCLNRIGCPKSISAVWDDNNKIQCTEIKGVPVLSIDEIRNRYANPDIIIVGEGDREIRELTEQIDDYGNIINNDSKLKVAERAFMRRGEYVHYQYWFEACCELYQTEKFKQDMELIETLLVDETSRQVLNNRINFLISGDMKFLIDMYRDETQYFSNNYYNKNITKNEIYVDLGTYDGDSLIDMMNFVGEEYEKIYAFEPNPEIYKRLITLIENKNWNNVESFQLGTSSKKSKVRFQDSDHGSRIADYDGNIVIDVDALDNKIFGPVTWIKMDVEGAEFETLKGAKKLIQKYKPKLAVSIYHGEEDIFKLPLYIHDLVPEYRFKITHYSHDLYETVLYADLY